MKDLITITTEYQIADKTQSTDGFYNIRKHGHSFEYEDKLYTYHGSGLCRAVYVSDCGKFVIKVPTGVHHQEMKSQMDFSDPMNFRRYADGTVKHNYYEAKAYEACPDKFKKYLAKTELLPNCWVRQEFVQVQSSKFIMNVDLREIGIREDGSLCIFDFDPLLKYFVFDSYDWTKLKPLIDSVKKGLKPTKNHA